MEIKKAITQLEIIATNMVGRLCEIPNEDERQIAILNKQIEALDMGIDALKTQTDLVRCGECKYMRKYALRSDEPTGIWCHRWSIPRLVTDDDFCSYGERRDDE